MLNNLKIALAQINPIVGNLGYNRDKILQFYADCSDDTDIIIFPELAICGYIPQDLIRREHFVTACEEEINKIRRKTVGNETAILLPCPIMQDGKTYNAAHLIHDGQIVATTLKHHLPNYGVFDETRFFKPGPLPSPVKFKGFNIGIMICEDLWHMDVGLHLKEQGADILIIPNGSPYSNDKRGIREYYAKLRANETGLPVIYVNQMGGQDELVFDGGSFIMDPGGNILMQMPYFEEQCGVLDKGEAVIDPTTKVIHDTTALTYTALVTGTKDYITKNGFSKALIGLSGGIDSALVASIAVDALGPENVRTIMMPTQFTSDESLEDAKACANALGCEYDIIPLEKPLKAFEETLELSGLAHENIQSRIRGTILMAESNKSGALLLATGNKSEMACGYATLYGDMNGAYNPLKDVYKTKVFELAKWRNTLSPVIPERIITKAPSAELRPDQKDEDSLPPYNLLDDILVGLIEEKSSKEDLIARGFDADLVLRVWIMLHRAEYKRFQSAPGPKVTEQALGSDRRIPMTNGYLNFIKSA